jgi:predicted nucleic acid-binding protein
MVGERMNLPRRLQGREDVVIDTMVFLYLFEDSPRYGELCETLLERAAEGAFSGVITPVTAGEVLVKPLKSKRQDTADAYLNALHTMENIRQVPVTFETGSLAAALRAKYGLPLPDMIQAACALQTLTPSIITNDRKMRRVKEIEVFLLNDMVAA